MGGQWSDRVHEQQKILAELQFVSDQLCETFSIAPSQLVARSKSELALHSSDDHMPDSFLDEGSGHLLLTPIGRYQVSKRCWLIFSAVFLTILLYF